MPNHNSDYDITTVLMSSNISNIECDMQQTSLNIPYIHSKRTSNFLRWKVIVISYSKKSPFLSPIFTQDKLLIFWAETHFYLILEEPSIHPPTHPPTNHIHSKRTSTFLRRKFSHPISKLKSSLTPIFTQKWFPIS